MLEELPRRAMSGIVWGLAVTVVLRMTQSKDGVSTLRPLAKTAMKGVVIVSEKIRELAEEARETVEDIYAETRAEQQAQEEEEVNPSVTPDEEAIQIDAGYAGQGEEPR
ncbi:MAG: DUF5132 domain-containing protein [Dehalococcoidia bacterium]|nr:DUF5132 domain-containing protein [Dehalococcoidia bacterium]